MTKNILILLLLFPLIIYGQETKKVVVNSPNKSFREEYYVLKSDKSIKHGKYKRFDFKNNLLILGHYKSGIKDSLWTEYHYFNKSIKSKGCYSKDRETGIWVYYNYDGEIDQTFDYSTNKFISYREHKRENGKYSSILVNLDTTINIQEIPPLYLGGISLLNEFIYKNIKYPELAKVDGISGTVEIEFIIDSIGSVNNYKVSKGIGFGCDEEALRVVKSIPNNWFPGIISGKPANCHFTLPINFKLN